MSKETSKIMVEGMSCNHCVNRIKKAVGALGGVDYVEIDLQGKEATIQYDPKEVALTTIKETIEDQGYDVQ